MKKHLILFLLLLLNCHNKKPFEWTDDLKPITGTNLKQWIEKSPFDNLWNSHKNNNDNIVIDNRNQVFPFMGKFKNENNNFKNYKTNGDIYKEETALFNDSQFGESFVYAALLYNSQELFLQPALSEMGNVAFSGANAINKRYYANLSETKIYNKNKTYKTAIYWVDANRKKYLFGFYQRGQLVFQFGFPCNMNNRSEGLKKIKEINQSLNLNVKEWANAQETDLNINNTPQSFWENPFIGIYHNKYTLPDVQVKTKNTGLKKLNKNLSYQKGVDYVFAHKNKQLLISFKRETTTVTAQEFVNKFKHGKQIITNNKDQLFITNEEVKNGQVIMDIETYFKNTSILKIQISYPENDNKAKEQLLDILNNLKIQKF